MAEIHVLDQNTINQIAAGEVVERPASIVKELVENAVDAQSTAITVEIKGGGIDFIRITDNGTGIAKDQIKKAFLAHATSKITSADDLLTVRSLGFRGEALSSICAVAKVELITKTDEGISGIRYIIEGGQEISFQDIGCPEGTTIVVRNLFYNTPARRKFLKSAMTEAGYVEAFVQRLSLSRPDISFKFISDNKNKISTAGNGNLKDVIYHIFGRDIAMNLLPVDREENGIHIHGYVGKPVISRGNRNYENYFVGGRYLKDPIIARAIEDGYKGHNMVHKFPFTVLMITMDSLYYDVNVHPAKMEMRFKNGEELYSAVSAAVKESFVKKELISRVSPGREEKKTSRGNKPAGPEPFERKRREIEARFSNLSEERIREIEARKREDDLRAKEEMAKVEQAKVEQAKGDQAKGEQAKVDQAKEVQAKEDRARENMAREQTAAVVQNRLDHLKACRPAISNLRNKGGFLPGAGVAESGGGYGREVQQAGGNGLKADGSGLQPGVVNPQAGSDGSQTGVTSPHPSNSSPQPSALSSQPDGSRPETGEANPQPSFLTPKGDQLSLTDAQFLSEEARPRHRIIGQVFRTYWMVEYQDQLFFVDQHAAHEKVMYEKLKKNLDEKRIDRQMVAPPIVLNLNIKEKNKLLTSWDAFASLGYEIEEFGEDAFCIRAVPANLYGIDQQDLFIEMLDQLEEGKNGLDLTMITDRLATMACKAAVKGNQTMTTAEMDSLMDQLLALENPYQCPHGRPTIISMTKYELEKKFKRIQ